jgi:hypothetical protein
LIRLEKDTGSKVCTTSATRLATAASAAPLATSTAASATGSTAAARAVFVILDVAIDQAGDGIVPSGDIRQAFSLSSGFRAIIAVRVVTTTSVSPSI